MNSNSNQITNPADKLGDPGVLGDKIGTPTLG